MGESEPPISGLDVVVAERIAAELGQKAGDRVLRCLRTAESLLRLSAEDGDDLRYAESAAYNLREALDSVVEDREAGRGGFAIAIEAWEHYKITSQLPGADEPSARVELAAVLDSLARDKERQAYMTRKLLEWFREQTGVAPIPGDVDPTLQYQRLRETAAGILHRDSPHAEVELLFGEAVAWFVRFFTPPSEVAEQLERLAQQSFSPDRLVELRSLAMNAHHLRLFLGRLEDPAWLEPMRKSGLIELPQSGELWSVNALVRESNKLPDEDIARLLERVLDDLKSLPKADRRASAWEIMRTASWLGQAGHGVVLEVLRRYPADDWTQMIAMSTAKDVAATDPIHVAVADAVIGNEPRRDHGHRTKEVLERLVDGMAEDNVAERFGLIAHKVRRLAAEDHAYLFIDIAALPLDGEDLWEPLLRAAQCLAAAVPKARSLGMSSASMLERIETIPGELGERLTCQVYAGSTDIDRDTKLVHLRRRVASETATGDDKALIDDLSPFEDNEIERLRDAFGSPSPRPADGEQASFGDNWPRGWRWSMILPDRVLAGWDEAIAEVTDVHGSPDISALEKRSSSARAGYGGTSPYSPDEIAEMDVLDAARLIADWRPNASDLWGTSARELARALEVAVKESPEAWTNDPVTVIRTLSLIPPNRHLSRVVANVFAG